MRFVICVLPGLDVTTSARRIPTSSEAVGNAQDEKIARFSMGDISGADRGLLNLKAFMLAMNPSAATRNYAARSRIGPASMYESYAASFGVGQADPNVWYIFPRDAAKYNGKQSPTRAKYVVSLGQEQVLGYNDLGQMEKMEGAWKGILWDRQLEMLADEQCAVEIAADGTHAILHALGTVPTGYKMKFGDPWKWLQPGDSVVMPHYGKISLLQGEPEVLVFKLGDGYLLQQEEAEMMQQQAQPTR